MGKATRIVVIHFRVFDIFSLQGKSVAMITSAELLHVKSNFMLLRNTTRLAGLVIQEPRNRGGRGGHAPPPTFFRILIFYFNTAIFLLVM